VALTADEQRALAELRQRTATLDEAIQRVVDTADAAEQAARLAVLPLVWDFRPDPDREGETATWPQADPDADALPLRVDQPWTRQGFPDLHGSG
jgi:hypothetical protein